MRFLSNHELISVIIPIYNVEQYLLECIESVVNQTYKHIEIILIDDGSTDKSGDICDEFARKDARIRVFHNKNHGVSYSRNQGLELAKGEYICFVDSDDVCEVNLIGTLYRTMNQKKVDYCLCAYNRYINEEKKKYQEPLSKGIYDKNRIINELILNMVGSPASSPRCAPIMGSLWRGLFKKSVINQKVPIKLQNIKIAEDLLFVLEYLLRCNTVFVIDEALYNYRLNDSSATRRYISDLYCTITNMHKMMKEILNNNDVYNDRMQEYLSMTILYNLTWCISNEAKENNPANQREIVKKIKKIRNSDEYKQVLLWRIIKNISIPERLYFIIIKLKLYKLIILFNRRK